MGDYDVVVVGGGISGSMAAIAAARSGARTLLVEQYGFLGGMLTAAGVGPMMTFHAGDEQVVRGLTGELVDRLVAKGKSPGHIVDTTGYTYTVTPFDAEGMKQELELMLLEAGGELLYHTMLAGADCSAGRIERIQVCNKSGLSSLQGKVFVDATGDADLSVFAGVGYTKGRESDGASQPLTMNLKMRGVDIAAVKEYIRGNLAEFPRLKGNATIIDRAPRLSIGGFVLTLQDGQARGDISFQREDILFFETNSPGEVIINTTRILGKDSVDPWSLTEAEIEGRRQARELERFLMAKVPGFEEAETVYSGPFVGVRGSRQIEGLYTLTAQDLLSSRWFPDVIAHAGYPVDIHCPDGTGTSHMHLQWGQKYGIPYRCLVNAKVDNLITVGRCISATFEAQAGIRTTPTVGAIGHAGGTAAAIAAKAATAARDVDVAELQERLLEQSAYLDLH